MFSSMLEEISIGGERLDAQQRRRIEQLGTLWTQYAPAMNLTARSDAASLGAQVRESLLLVELAHQLGVGPSARWVDVGSGGGFPGLVVAAALEGVELVLVEPRQRRASFLELALASIGRRDCRVVRARLEDRGWKPIDRDDTLRSTRFACASSRATFAPEQWLARARTIVEPEGLVFCHLRVGQEDPEGFDSIGRCQDERWSVRAYRA